MKWMKVAAELIAGCAVASVMLDDIADDLDRAPVVGDVTAAVVAVAEDLRRPVGS